MIRIKKDIGKLSAFVFHFNIRRQMLGARIKIRSYSNRIHFEEI